MVVSSVSLGTVENAMDPAAEYTNAGSKVAMLLTRQSSIARRRARLDRDMVQTFPAGLHRQKLVGRFLL